MEENKPQDSDSSKLFGVSVRGWVAVTVVLTVCAMSLASVTVIEPLYSLSLLATGFYFGQNKNK